MDRKKLESVIKKIPGIQDVAWLSDEERQKIAELEGLQEKKGVSTKGAGAYQNPGMSQVLSRQEVCIILNDNNFRHALTPSLWWMMGDVIIGEEITDPEKLAEIQKTQKVKMMGEKFVVYFDRMKTAPREEPRWVIQGLDFPEIEHFPGIKDVISAAPVGSVDVYLKEKFGWNLNDSTLGTIAIGLNVKE